MELKKQVQQIAEIIKKGGIVIFPTETVYALACSPYNKDAIKRIKNIKSRDKNKPLSVLCEDFKQLSEIVIVDDFSELVKKYTPGPVTFVLKARDETKFVSDLNPRSNTIGVRIPDHQVAQQIIKIVQTPVIATSVNFSGDPAATKISDIPKKIIQEVDLILELGISEIGIGSTVVDLTNKEDIKILRQGSVNVEI